MKPLTEQVAEAERVFRQAHKRHPRAGRTARLHWEWTKLKVRLIAEEVRQEKRAQNAAA